MFLEKKIEDDFELGNKLKEFEGGSINGSDKGGSNAESRRRHFPTIGLVKREGQEKEGL